MENENIAIENNNQPKEYKSDLYSNQRESLDPKNEELKMSNRERYIIFAMISSISLLSNLDNGIIPCATTEIQNDLKVEQEETGLFGSADYLGRVISK
ncbi:MAG: hypothetical protein MJ252_17070 [archaeon]|nr:hypothetical protein [archaeon]